MSAKAVRWVPLDRDRCTLYEINKSMFMFMFYTLYPGTKLINLCYVMLCYVMSGYPSLHEFRLAPLSSHLAHILRGGRKGPGSL